MLKAASQSHWLLGRLDAGQGPREGGAPPSSLRVLKGFLVVDNDCANGGSLRHSFCLLYVGNIFYDGECFLGLPRAQQDVCPFCFRYTHCYFSPCAESFLLRFIFQKIFDKAYLITHCKYKQAQTSKQRHTLVVSFYSVYKAHCPAPEIFALKSIRSETPGWLSRLSVRLWLRS